MDDNIEALKRQLEIHRRNLRKLEERAALYGSLDVPLKLLNEIELEEKKIARLEENIRIIIEIEVGPKPKEKSVREEVRGRGKGCIIWWSSLSVEMKVAYIGLISAVIVAIIGLGQPIVTELARSYFAPTPTSVAVAPTYTPTPIATTTPTGTPTSTLTPMPTSTATPTNTPAPAPPPTEAPTPPPTPDPRATVLSLIETEKEAVLIESLDLIKAIFARDATITDAATSQSWNTIQYYTATFATKDYLEITHTNFDVTNAGDEATVTNDSCGSFIITATGEKIDYNCPQCDQWTFDRDANGQWWITDMAYGLVSTAHSHSYAFEDGTNGCWWVRYEGGESQGQMPTFTTELAHQGHGSLRFAFDLARVSRHRGQIIRYNMPFAGKASAYVYALPDAPADLEAGFFAMELDHDPWNYYEANQMSPLIPGQWTQIIWNIDTSGWVQPLHLFGIEVRQVSGGYYSGYVLIDDVFIKSR